MAYESLNETRGGRIQSPYMISPQRTGGGGNTTMAFVPGDTSAQQIQPPQMQPQQFDPRVMMYGSDGVGPVPATPASGPQVQLPPLQPQPLQPIVPGSATTMLPQVAGQQPPGTGVNPPVTNPPVSGGGGGTTNPGTNTGTTGNPPVSGQGGGVTNPGGGGSTNPGGGQVDPTGGTAGQGGTDPNDAIGLGNLGALIERLLANPSGFSSEQAQQYRDQAAVERGERRTTQTAAINADAARRGMFHSTAPMTSIGDLETSLGREEAMLDANLQTAVAQSQQQGLRDAIGAAMGFTNMGMQQSQGMANIGNIMASLGFQGAPDFNVMMNSLLGMGGGDAPQLDGAMMGMLLASLFNGGQGGGGGGGMDWGSVWDSISGWLTGGGQGGQAPMPGQNPGGQPSGGSDPWGGTGPYR